MCANLGLPSHVGLAEAGLLGEVQGQQAEERGETRAQRSGGALTIRMRERSTQIRNITNNTHNLRMEQISKHMKNNMSHVPRNLREFVNNVAQTNLYQELSETFDRASESTTSDFYTGPSHDSRK